MLKRLADWLEKMSVATLAIGVLQGQNLGIVIGGACMAGSLLITRKLGGK
jgi:hypothetical protein